MSSRFEDGPNLVCQDSQADTGKHKQNRGDQQRKEADMVVCANEPLNGKNPHGFEVFLDMLATGKIDPSPVITHRFPIEKYRDAFVTAYDKKRNKSIKVLFEF